MPERRVVPGDTLNGALRGAALELSHGLEPTPVRQKTDLARRRRGNGAPTAQLSCVLIHELAD